MLEAFQAGCSVSAEDEVEVLKVNRAGLWHRYGKPVESMLSFVSQTQSLRVVCAPKQGSQKAMHPGPDSPPSPLCFTPLQQYEAGFWCWPRSCLGTDCCMDPAVPCCGRKALLCWQCVSRWLGEAVLTHLPPPLLLPWEVVSLNSLCFQALHLFFPVKHIVDFAQSPVLPNTTRPALNPACISILVQ